MVVLFNIQKLKVRTRSQQSFKKWCQNHDVEYEYYENGLILDKKWVLTPYNEDSNIIVLVGPEFLEYENTPPSQPRKIEIFDQFVGWWENHNIKCYPIGYNQTGYKAFLLESIKDGTRTGIDTFQYADLIYLDKYS